MVIAGIIFSLVIIVIGMVIDYNHEELTGLFYFIGGMGLLINCVTLVITIFQVSNGMVIDKKINMYSEENTKIEEQIQAIVSDYKDYESSTLEKFANESPTVLISLFPELKTNDLVNKQMDIYLANNNKIKELKESQINVKVSKWWLYFGK